MLYWLLNRENVMIFDCSDEGAGGLDGDDELGCDMLRRLLKNGSLLY